MGIKEMFSGEGYSKEENVQEIKRLNELKDEQNVLPPELPEHLTASAPGWPQGKTPHETIRTKIEKAKSRISAIIGKGQAEAKGLNEDYDSLLAEAQKAQDAVKDFEVNKLGMSQETES